MPLSTTHLSLSHCLGAMRHVAGVFLYFEPSCISVFLLSADWTTMGSGGAQQDCQVWGNIRRNPQKTKKQSQQRLIYRPSTTFLQKSPLPVLDDISADNILPICRSGYFSQFLEFSKKIRKLQSYELFLKFFSSDWLFVLQ